MSVPLCYICFENNNISTGEQNVEKVPFSKNKREQTRQVLSEEILGNIGVRFEAPTQLYLKTVIPGNRCIKVICIGSHTTASSETIQT
jgi:hypothetical protein